MARAPVLAAGGIVLREEATPLIAVVRLRKRNEWVLPKGKLDDGETPRDAALREVLEETGHDVAVHEFLGTLVYESGGRSKVVHYWRMAADGEPSYELMDDVTAVDWLPLDAALARLSRSSERVFLANVGPLALEAAALARLSRRSKAKRPAAEKRRGRQAAAPRTLPAQPVLAPPQPDPGPPAIGQHQRPSIVSDVVETKPSIGASAVETVPQLVEADARRNLVQKVRDWLRRAA